MIAILDTNRIDQAAAELGVGVEQLLTPLTLFRRVHQDAPFAIDNGAFAGFDPRRFKLLLDRERSARKLCRWVVAPDVVANARRTLECFDEWSHRLRDGGWRVALAIQDGSEDLEIPWRIVDALFVGGTTRFKYSAAAADVMRAAKILGKWIHGGRVNTPGRWEYFEALGADSIDGSGLARYSHMRLAILSRRQGSLDLDGGSRAEIEFERGGGTGG